MAGRKVYSEDFGLLVSRKPVKGTRANGKLRFLVQPNVVNRSESGRVLQTGMNFGVICFAAGELSNPVNKP